MEKLQIGDMIRELRRNKGFTQEELAETLGVSTPAICKWESGQSNPDINMLPVIARFFQVSIDFLLGFSTELSSEKVKSICDDITQKFIELPFTDAKREWLDYLKQYPACLSLRFELANLAVFHLAKAETEKEIFSFVLKVIDVFEQCTKSDELKIKQSSYFQMANMYIVLQDFDKAETVLNKIPVQLVNPRFLLSTIYTRKQDYKRAIKNIQENLYRSINDIFAELGNLLSVYHSTEAGNTELILDIYNKQKNIINTFGLEPLYGCIVGMMIALISAQTNDHEKAKIELQKIVEIFEKYPPGTITINKIPFFDNLEPSIQEKSGNSFSVETHRMVLEQIFSLLEKSEENLNLKTRMESVLK